MMLCRIPADERAGMAPKADHCSRRSYEIGS